MGRKTKRNKLFSKETWEKVNNQNKELMDEFLEYLKSTDHAPSSIVQYRYDLKQLFCYICENAGNKHFTELTKRDWLKWQNTAINTYNWSTNRLSRVRSSAHSLEMYIEGFCDDIWPDYRPVSNKIPKPQKQLVRDKTILTVDEVEIYLQDYIKDGKLEQAVLFALAAYSGRRKSELSQFKMEDFADDCIVAGALYKTKNKIKTKGHGVNGKQINCYVLKHPFDKYLNIWKEYRANNNIESEWLLYKPDDPTKPLPVTTIDSWAVQLSKRTGKDIYLHSFRHLFTTHLVKSGIPNSVIKDIVKWQSSDMIDIYNDSDVDDELDKYFNEDGIIQRDKVGLSDL